MFVPDLMRRPSNIRWKELYDYKSEVARAGWDTEPLSTQLLRAAARAWHQENPWCDELGYHYLIAAERTLCEMDPRIIRRDPTLPDVAAGTHVVYDAIGNTDSLYVGVTSNFPARMRAHARKSAWWPYAHMIRIDTFTTRADANAAELDLIVSTRPTFNKAGIR